MLLESLFIDLVSRGLLPLQGRKNENMILSVDDILNLKLIKLKDFFNLLNNFFYNIFLKIRF
jgi:hypothetical protein